MPEFWTIAEVADYLGAASTGSARKTLSRWGVKAVGRQPGRAGVSLYDPAVVRAARESAPGQGARTDRAPASIRNHIARHHKEN